MNLLSDLYKRNLENTYKNICQEIIKLNQKYYDGLCSIKELIEKYNKLYIYRYKLEKLTKKSYYEDYLKAYKYDKDKAIFTIDHEVKIHDVDYNLLNDLEHKEYYTVEEAENLIKWTVNNTRENLKKEVQIDNLDHCNLTGCCGFSQFSSIYPFEKLGLKTTYNNTANFFGKKGGDHGYGTVEIPVIINGEIVKKTYIIDCTYSQFFLLKDCVEGKYLNAIDPNALAAPSAGYFMNMNDDLRTFAKTMLEDGYCEMTDDNLKKYAFGLYMQAVKLDEFKEKMNSFNTIDFKKIMNSSYSEADYDEEEFIGWGYNLQINAPSQKNGR